MAEEAGFTVDKDKGAVRGWPIGVEFWIPSEVDVVAADAKEC
jgi:hypothetical protein